MDLRSALQATAAAVQPPAQVQMLKHDPSLNICDSRPLRSLLKRWFTLLRNRLYYCEINGAPAINFILIEEGTIIEPQKEKTTKQARHGFLVKTTYTHRVYYIATEHADEQQSWIAALNKVCNQAKHKGTEHVNVPRTPKSPRERLLVLDVLVRHGEFTVSGSSAKIRVEVQLAQVTHQTFGIRLAKGPSGALKWDSDCTFLEIRVLADREVIGLVSLEEEKWSQYVAATTLRIDTANAAVGFVDVKLHRSYENDSDALLYHRGIASRVIPFRLDAGDILLFSSSHLLSYGTKIFTMSRWDHVALVVRWFNGKLRLIEAIDDGVKLYELDERLALCTTAQIAVLMPIKRRLNVERSDAILDQVHAFVHKVRGRPFKRDLLDLARAAGHFTTQANIATGKEDMSSLFCSQLCAAAYQGMGLLSKNRPTTEFMPRDWASKDLSPFVSAQGAPTWSLQPRKSKYHVVKPRSVSPSRSSPRSHYTSRPSTVYNAPPSTVSSLALSMPTAGMGHAHGHSRNTSLDQISASSSAGASPSSTSSTSFFQPRSPRSHSSATVQIGSERTQSGSGRLITVPPRTAATAQAEEAVIEEAKSEALRKAALEENKRYSVLPDLWLALAGSPDINVAAGSPSAPRSTSPWRPATADSRLAPMNVSTNV